jgi:hypothetical protein
VKKVKFTDAAKFRYPYADSKASAEPGYLADRFRQIREQQAKDEMERKDKVRPVKRAAA